MGRLRGRCFGEVHDLYSHAREALGYAHGSAHSDKRPFCIDRVLDAMP